MTVADFKQALNAAGVQYASKATKAELAELLAALPADVDAAPSTSATHRTNEPVPLIRSLAKRRQVRHR